MDVMKTSVMRKRSREVLIAGKDLGDKLFCVRTITYWLIMLILI